MKSLVGSSVTAFCLLLVLPGRAWCQVPIYLDAVQREWQSEFRSMVTDNYQRLMTPRLTNEEAARLRNVKFDFPIDQDAVAFRFFATENGQIVMPVASLLFLKDLSLAYAWLNANGYSPQTVFDYLTLFIRGRLQRWPKELWPPPKALGIPESAAKEPKVLDARNEILSKTILFIMAHELGHVVQGLSAHRSGVAADIRQAEAAADLFAVDLFGRMGLLPNGAASFFAFSARLAPARSEFADVEAWRRDLEKRTHPLDGQRINAMANRIEAQRDVFARAFSNPSLAVSRVKQLVTELREVARYLDDPSVSQLQRDWAMSFEPQDLRPRRALAPELLPRAGERFAAAPFSGFYQGKITSSRSKEDAALSAILRRDKDRLIGETSYLGLRGRIEGTIDGLNSDARWTVGSAVYTLKLTSDGSGSQVKAKYRVDSQPSLFGEWNLDRRESR
jgi:hypothetical protein